MSGGSFWRALAGLLLAFGLLMVAVLVLAWATMGT